MRLAPRWSSFVMLSVAALLVVVGGLMASNMSFKVSVPLDAPTTAVSHSGINLVSLPYIPQQDLVALEDPDTPGRMTAGGLLQHINQGVCIGKPAAAVQKYDRLTDLPLLSYDGCSGMDFVLEPGEAYFVIMRETADLRISGTHDPTFIIEFLPESAGVSKSGRQLYAHPYHGVASTAYELVMEIGALQIEKYDRTTDSFVPYPGSANFDLTAGEGYLVRVSSITNYIPAHY